VCNWLVPTASSERFCVACRHNRTIPDLTRPANLLAWRKIEDAKHRLFYSILRLGLPLETRAKNPKNGLVFDFLTDPPAQQGPKIMTGHNDDRITIALVEADDAERESAEPRWENPRQVQQGSAKMSVPHCGSAAQLRPQRSR
jgi:hypothetical protein